MLLLAHWLVFALAILLASYLLPGVRLAGFGSALAAALVLGLVNAILRPFLLILTLPLNILTLGLFTFMVNTLLIMLTSAVVGGFTVRSFWWALLFGIILSVIHFILVRMAFGPTAWPPAA